MTNQSWQKDSYALCVLRNSGTAWETRHPDVDRFWVVRGIADPNKQEWDRDDIYFSWVPERKKWLKVVVEDDRIATAHLDRRLLKRFGVIESA